MFQTDFMNEMKREHLFGFKYKIYPMLSKEHFIKRGLTRYANIQH